jgi:hypothetical protein
MYNHASLRGGSPCADVVELVDTLDSKSGFFGSDGSSPSSATITYKTTAIYYLLNLNLPFHQLMKSPSNLS